MCGGQHEIWGQQVHTRSKWIYLHDCGEYHAEILHPSVVVIVHDARVHLQRMLHQINHAPKIRSGKVRSGQVRSNQIRSDHRGSDQMLQQPSTHLLPVLLSLLTVYWRTTKRMMKAQRTAFSTQACCSSTRFNVYLHQHCFSIFMNINGSLALRYQRLSCINASM